MDETIQKLFLKTSKYLVKKQKEDGKWVVGEIKFKEPPTRFKEIVLASENALTLITICNPETIKNIKKSLYFCAELSFEEHDKIELWAWKLYALKFIDTERYKKEREKIVKYLCKKQSGGCWITYPGTFNLTNFEIIRSLHGFKCKKIIENAVLWFKKNRARDNMGWGVDEHAKKSENTFTSNVVLALMLAGEDPTSEYLQKIKRFLYGGQKKDGGWLSTELTIKKTTTYATAISLLSLMVLSNNPFNENIKRGINFLLKTASSKGGWPLIDGKNPEFYTTFYSVQTLAFYEYLKERWDDADVVSLRKKIKPQQVTAILFQNFENYLKKRFEECVLRNALCSKALGSTIRSIERRKDILKILSKAGSKDVAGIIDELKKDDKYSYLNKKHHITQIKSDVEFLRGLNLVNKIRTNYFVVIDAIY